MRDEVELEDEDEDEEMRNKQRRRYKSGRATIQHTLGFPGAWAPGAGLKGWRARGLEGWRAVRL